MIIVCPSCSTRYNVGDETLADRARRVRCAQCGNVWSQEPENAPDVKAEAAPEPASAATPGAASELAVDANAAADPDGAFISPFSEEVQLSSPLWVGLLHRGASVLVAVLVLGGIVAGLSLYRGEIVRAWPGSAGFFEALNMPVNLAGMEIRNTSWEIDKSGRFPVLVVRGEVANIDDGVRAVPKLRLMLRDKKARELYHWEVVPEVSEVEPGEVVPFTTRIESPPAEAYDVEVRFDLTH